MNTLDNGQPHVMAADGKRRFACSPVAVSAIIVNERGEVLLLSNPEHSHGWQVVNGAMDAGETALEAALRETYEEVGSRILVRPLGTVHVSTFHYDERARYMLNVSFLFAYEGGALLPGDDMEGSEIKWWSYDELESGDVKLLIPPDGNWLLARAVELYHLWVKEDATHQPGFNWTVRGKTK